MDEKVLEMAEAFQQAEVDSGIAKVRARIRPRDPLFDGNCRECGDPIPPKRLSFGVETCHPCQVEVERLEKFGR